ncbi:MAG: TPM domain-containing protein [Treponemataceae bacterium]|nr:TPM domain-containing protein [Treponemataceae bacterium]
MFVFPAFAENTDDREAFDGTDTVMDYANLLSVSELDNLEMKISSLVNQYGMGIYIMTIPDKSFVEAEGYDIQTIAEYIYEVLSLGLGEEKNGILLLMDMNEREYDICAYGSRAHYSFTDYGKDKLEEAFLDDFGENDWFGGFSLYVDEVERELIWAEKGDPVDVGSTSESLRELIGIPGILIVSFLIGLVLAFIVCWYFKLQMKSVRPAASAEKFISSNGIDYSEKIDDYIKTTQSVRIIESSSKSGGTSVNSGGYSHSSGKF